MVVIGYFSEQINRITCVFERFTVLKEETKTMSLSIYFLFLLTVEPLESRYTMIHICWKMTHDNHICPFITKTFENFYALHELGKLDNFLWWFVQVGSPLQWQYASIHIVKFGHKCIQSVWSCGLHSWLTRRWPGFDSLSTLFFFKSSYYDPSLICCYFK